MTLTTWIIITVISLIFSGLFSGTEIAYITSDRVRVELDVKRGGFINRIINRFYSNSELFISTILVGNNIVLVIYGMGAAALLEPWLATINPNEAFILIAQTLISTGIILVTGEFFPKTIFRINPNATMKLVSPLIYFFYLILYPISAFTSWLSRVLMKLCGIKTQQARLGALSLDELNSYIERSLGLAAPKDRKEEVEHEVQIFHNALDFSETQLRDCMIPRNEMIVADIDETTREQLSEMFTRSGRSKIVVYSGDIDNIKGYIHVSELFDPTVDWRTRVKEVIFSPETLLANKLMRRLLSEKRSMAIVVDEFGGTAGLVTLEDLVEEIFGDIEDEHDKAREEAVEVSPGVYDFSGRIEIRALRDDFGLDIPEDDEYQTLAGYLLFSTGTIPQVDEELQIGKYIFNVRKRSATRIELVRVSPAPPSED